MTTEEGKTVAVKGRTGVLDCDISRISRCLDNQLLDGGLVFSLAALHPQKYLLVLIYVRG
jgi:hypothetical protein